MTANQKKNKTQIDDKVKGDFITIASHQLRTPIAAIRWSLDTLLNNRAGKLSEKQKAIIAGAYQNNAFLAKAVSDLLRASRLEGSQLDLVPEKLTLGAVVTEIVKRLEPFAKAFNCQLIFKPDRDLPLVYFDSLQLKPIIEGVIDNAIRYSKTSGVKNEIEVTAKTSSHYVVLTVADRGIGIPQDQQALVFTRFFRARNAMKAQTEGLGLDLYIAKRIIDRSGGKISFSTIENKGTTFYIYLPIHPPAEKPTEKKPGLLVDEAKKALANEREFVSITVHELKAPLGMAKWSLEMLKKGKVGRLSSAQLELINQVYRGNERLLVLVRDLLDLAKLQEGHFDVEPQLMDVKTIIDDCVTAFRAQAEKKKIILVLPNLKGQWPAVMGDPNRVAQVVTNLVSNAVKYTPVKGTVTVAVEKYSGPQLKKMGEQIATANISNTKNKKGYLVISVKDTGIGISESDQNKLFSRFFRSKNVLQTKTEGTGLGLYITKTIVDLHKGDIWFTSRVGAGSTFYFSLPIA